MSDEVRVERQGPVTTVIIDRPNARNAVNGPTAAQLVTAFEEFDADDSASVAVLWGDNGTSARAPISRRSEHRSPTSCTAQGPVRWGRRE